MPKPVKIIIVLVLLIGGADAARDYFTAGEQAGPEGRVGEIINFWSFVAVLLCLIGYLAWRRFRARR